MLFLTTTSIKTDYPTNLVGWRCIISSVIFLLLLTIRYSIRRSCTFEDNYSCYINYVLSLYYHVHGQIHEVYLKDIQMGNPFLVLRIPNRIKSSKDIMKIIYLWWNHCKTLYGYKFFLINWYVLKHYLKDAFTLRYALTDGSFIICARS